MGFPRFYHPEPIALHHNIKLSESAARHAGIVLRLSVGDALVLFNGDGFDYSCKITESTRKAISVRVEAKKTIHSESPLKLHLAQAIVKPDKMDWVMQKAVELGVNEITPVMTKYCAVKITEKKLDHWQGIITSACEQSGRSIMPTLNKIIILEKFLVENNLNKNLIFHPEAEQKFSELKMNYTEAVILIGPEGGFHPDEVELAEKNGFLSVRLGSRILRAETAATAALSVMQSRWGDF